MKRRRGVTLSTTGRVLLGMIAPQNPVQCSTRTVRMSGTVQLYWAPAAVLKARGMRDAAEDSGTASFLPQSEWARVAQSVKPAAGGVAMAAAPNLNCECLSPSSCAIVIKDTPNRRRWLQQPVWQGSAITWQSPATLWQGSATLWREFAIRLRAGAAVLCSVANATSAGIRRIRFVSLEDCRDGTARDSRTPFPAAKPANQHPENSRVCRVLPSQRTGCATGPHSFASHSFASAQRPLTHTAIPARYAKPSFALRIAKTNDTL